MTRSGPRRLAAPFIALLSALVLSPGPAAAQAVDCTALRAELDGAGVAFDPAQAGAALRRQRDEIARARDDADRTGCGDGFFDDPDAAPCRSIARRIGTLQVGLQRLQDQAARGDPVGDDRRRSLRARFDAECTADRADPQGEAVTAPPVDPDAPPGPAASPKASRVLCVRHCDGAYYPLAVDVSSDRMPDMDRICRAQCPSAEASAYAGDDGDVSSAVATDGSTYSTLPAAFEYLKGSSEACACRAPRQSWSQALSAAEALLQPHKGDVTVTAELAASMARPVGSPQKTAPAPAKPTPTASKRARATPLPAVPRPLPDRDLMRDFRGGGSRL